MDQIPGLQLERPPSPFGGKRSEMSPVEKFLKPNDPQVCIFACADIFYLLCRFQKFVYMQS